MTQTERESELLASLEAAAARQRRLADGRLWTIALTTADGCKRELEHRGRPPDEWRMPVVRKTQWLIPPGPVVQPMVLERRYRMDDIDHDRAIAYYREEVE